MSELRSIYYLDREWKTYLEDKEYIYSDVTVFRQEKKILFKYTDIEYSNMHDKSSKDPRWPIQKREEEIAKFCKQYGIRFDVETKIDYSEPFTEGSKTVRNARIFKNEGVAPLKDRSEKEFFAALVMEGIHRELIEKGSSSVLDIYADSSAGHSADGCEAFMIVMYKQ